MLMFLNVMFFYHLCLFDIILMAKGLIILYTHVCGPHHIGCNARASPQVLGSYRKEVHAWMSMGSGPLDVNVGLRLIDSHFG